MRAPFTASGEATSDFLALLMVGRERGYLTPDDVIAVLEGVELRPELISLVIGRVRAEGIEWREAGELLSDEGLHELASEVRGCGQDAERNGGMIDTRPTWRLVLDAAVALTETGRTPFRLVELVEEVQRRDPSRGFTSIQPVVQGMTVNARKGPPSACGKPLRRVDRGLYQLVSATTLAPDDQFSWWGRGRALYDLGRYEEALAMYERAIQLAPKNAQNWRARGEALYHLGRYEEALAACERALELDPEDANNWNNKAVVLAAFGSQDLVDQLERLARLYETGVLDDEEFRLAKRRLLS